MMTIKSRDLRIVFFRSNRISNRIGRPIRFRIEYSNRPVLRQQLFTLYTYSEYLIHRYFVFAFIACCFSARMGSQVIMPYRGDSYFIKDLKVAGELGQKLFLVICYC